MAAAVCFPGVACHGELVTLAVASNFLLPAQALESVFETTSGHELRLSSGSTGQLYAQILNGAPFDVFLAADTQRPELLIEQGTAEAQSAFVYAAGRLALWSGEPERVTSQSLAALAELEFRWLAIAEPQVAPYGRAARQTLEKLGLWEALQPRIVRGQNIGQTFSMAQTRNAEFALVAMSQALAWDGPASYSIVPSGYHEPIEQSAVLLRRAGHNEAARAFMQFLRSPAAAKIIARYGYNSASEAP